MAEFNETILTIIVEVQLVSVGSLLPCKPEPPEGGNAESGLGLGATVAPDEVRVGVSVNSHPGLVLVIC